MTKKKKRRLTGPLVKHPRGRAQDHNFSLSKFLVLWDNTKENNKHKNKAVNIKIIINHKMLKTLLRSAGCGSHQTAPKICLMERVNNKDKTNNVTTNDSKVKLKTRNEGKNSALRCVITARSQCES